MNLLKVNKVEGQVQAGNVITITCPLGPTYDKIILDLSGTPTAPDTETFTTADLDEVTIRANGRIIYQVAAADIQAMLDYKAIFTDVTVLHLDFTESKARGGAAEQLLTTIPSALLQNLTVEVKIKSGATLPSNGAAKITAYMQARRPSKNPFVQKVLPFNTSFSASGRQTYYMPTGNAGSIVKRVWLFQSDIIDAIEMRNNNVIIFEATKERLEFVQKVNDLVPASGLLVADFVADGNITTDAINTVSGKEALLNLDLNASGTIRGYLEIIDPINRL